MPKLRITLTLIFATVLSSQAAAWSERGHHIIALIAYDLLDESDQARLLEILADGTLGRAKK